MGIALAASAGKYYCGDCSPDSDQGYAAGETIAFIKGVVNPAVQSWIDAQGNPLDVTICNGATCTAYTYVKLVSLYKVKLKYASSWRGEPSSGGGGEPGGGSSGGGAGGGGVVVVGPIGKPEEDSDDR